jgi:O-antigen ligase
MIAKPRIEFNQIVSLATFISVAVLGYQIVLNPGSKLSLLLAGAMAILMIAWRPVIGLATYLVVYPMVPAEESLNMLKAVMVGLTVVLSAIWLIQKLISNKSLHLKPEYRWLFIFFIFLCFSPLLGSSNNFTLVDWARDIAPLLNLLLIPMMVDYFSKKQNHWLLYLIFTPWMLGTVQNILLLLAMYGVPLTDRVYDVPRINPLHPSLSVGLGLLMYLLKSPWGSFWLVFGIMNLATVFLTPGRTIWITTLTILFLIVIFSSKKRLWATLSMGTLVVLMAFLFFQKGPSTYIESQRGRLQQLAEYRYDLSFENRLEEIKQSGELFLSSPLWGVGFGYQYDFWRPFITGVGPGFMDTNYTHSDIMYIVSKGGMIGLILFGLMHYGLGKKLFRRRKENPGSIQSAWATIAIIALLNSLIIGLSTPIFQSRWAAFTLAILLAMGIGYRGAESSGR